MANDTSIKSPQTQSSPFTLKTIFIGLILPIVIFVAAAGWLVVADPLRLFDNSIPPGEEITFEQVRLDNKGIHLDIRAGGTEKMTIAQVQVDGAYWEFTQQPKGELDRLESATIHIPYPWVLEDAHVIALLTNIGTTFEHEIEVAIATQAAATLGWGTLAMIGIFVGLIPVAVGMMFFPVFRHFSPPGTRFVLALTLGMLAFLAVDMGFEAFELAAKAAPGLQAGALVVLAVVFSALTLIALGRKNGPPDALSLAYFMAFGIGLHNFGEGLAIGSAMAVGAVGLSGFLVLGFSVHNITEGIGIAAPLTKKPPRLITFAILAIIAGLPAVFGVWAGTFALAPHWAAWGFAIGMGAIVQVLFEVGGFMARTAGGIDKALDQYALAGFAFGLLFMYATAVAIKM